MEEKNLESGDIPVQGSAKRNEEILRLIAVYTENQKDIDAQRLARMEAMRLTVPKNIVSLLDKMDTSYGNHPNWPKRKTFKTNRTPQK
jgi:hypothetical protein